MLNQATMDMLTAMKMTAMAAEFANQLKDPTFNELGFEERLGLLVNAEWNRRQSNPTEQQTEPVYPQCTLRRAVCHCGMHTPPQEYSMTAEGGALVPREWCIHSGEMVHGGRRRGAPSRHAGAYSGRALRLRMDSPSIWIVYAL